MRLYFFIFFFLIFLHSFSQKNNFITKFEISKGNETVTYQEGIDYLTNLSNNFEQLKSFTFGQTDVGKPLHLFVLSTDKTFDPLTAKKKGKIVLLINNNIHPGEPDGIDASMMLVRDLLQQKNLNELLKDIVICIIPFYNIDGTLNRGSFSRANQNGPLEYGFRGNSRNYDLNRDFIKNDTKNSKSFVEIFQTWQPDIFIDNHVSNGADYQYTMTYIPTQKDKLGGILGEYLDKQLVPELKIKMKASHFEMTPFVNEISETPDSAGIAGFLETPRFSTGYAALFNTIGFMPESHMLKQYQQRVAGTYQFMLNMIKIIEKDKNKILELRRKTNEDIKTRKEFVLKWTMAKESYTKINFKGYKASYIPSKVTTGKRLFYDRSKPFEKEIPYYNNFKPEITVQKPLAYVIPKQWENVVEHLRINRVEMKVLEQDSVIKTETYYIDDYKTTAKPYEGHYLHSEVKIRKENQIIKFSKGDYVIYCNQEVNRYIIETLEPQAPDSFFNWNFFDPVLQQKEGYSDYVFEDLALEILNKYPEIKTALEEKKKSDPEFKADATAQLDFIYKNSPYHEKTHLRYPVFRVNE